MTYKNFSLLIGPGHRHGVEVRLIDSPAGQGAVEPLQLPIDLQEPFSELMPGLATRHVLSAGHRETTGSDPRILGHQLFSSLFQGQVKDLFERSVGMVGHAGLRIQLRFAISEAGIERISNLPWELMYRPDLRDFLSLSRSTPVVRHLDVPRPVACSPVPQPLRILVVASRPPNLPPLDLDGEGRHLEAALESVPEVRVHRMEQLTAEAVRRELLNCPYHVLHFMGHGSADAGTGRIYGNDATGRAAAVRGEELANLAKDFPSLRLVFLNACSTGWETPEASAGGFSGVAQALVMGGVRGVIAMRIPISDRAAVDFSRLVYARLAHGDSLEGAVVEGRQVLYQACPDDVEWATPMLFLRGAGGRLVESAEESDVRARTVARDAAAPRQGGASIQIGDVGSVGGNFTVGGGDLHLEED